MTERDQNEAEKDPIGDLIRHLRHERMRKDPKATCYYNSKKG